MATRSRKLLRVLLIILVGPPLLAFVAALILNWVMPRVVHLGDEVQVPDVRGFPLEEAQRILLEADLQPVVFGEKTIPDLPEGLVVDQLPPPGMEVKRGRTIRLVVNVGPRRIELPNLVGMPFRQARVILRNRGLEVRGVFYAFSDSIPEGYVISLYPPPGTYLEPGDSVDLVVSQGKRLVTVPDLYGLTLEDARKALEKRGLKLGEVIRRDPLGVVVEQDPPALMEVEPGTPVRVTLDRPY